MKQEAEYKGRDFDLIKTDWLRNKNKIKKQSKYNRTWNAFGSALGCSDKGGLKRKALRIWCCGRASCRRNVVLLEVEDRKLTEGQRIGERIDWKGSFERSQNRASTAVWKGSWKAWVRGKEGALRAAVR